MNKKIKKTGKNILDAIFPGNEPDFIIVGAQKAGTSSLHHYLKQHPEIIGSRPKEVRYFDRDDNYRKGKKWYEKAFKDYKNPFRNGLYFEATPEYLYRSFSAERMHAYKPDLKIIIIMREPVKRAYSSWNMYRDFPIKFKGKLPGMLEAEEGYIHDRENNLVKELYTAETFPTFEETTTAEIQKIKTNSTLEEPSFLRRGIYLPQIKRYHDLFGKEQVLVLGFKDLIKNKVETLNKIMLFLGLEKHNWGFLDDEKKNVRTYPKKISSEMEEKLMDFYKPYNEALFDYLETKINW